MIRGVETWPLAVLLLAASAAHAVDGADRCGWDKLRTAATYTLCRMKAASSARRATQLPDFGACDARYEARWQKIEAKAGPGVCPSEGDLATIRGLIADHTGSLVQLLSGGSPVPRCGNGVVESGEDCDFGILNGETCASQGFLAGELRCAPGTCRFDSSGCTSVRFVDNGDGTVTDRETGLMWEKKTNPGGGTSDCPGGATCSDPHDVDNRYLWTASGTAADGGAFTEFLAALNDCRDDGAALPPTGLTGGFAGYCDWRLPTLFELETLVDCDRGAPCIDPIFGATAAPQGYWSSTTYGVVPELAFFVSFSLGVSDFDTKGAQAPVRAVRRASD